MLTFHELQSSFNSRTTLLCQRNLARGVARGLHALLSWSRSSLFMPLKKRTNSICLQLWFEGILLVN